MSNHKLIVVVKLVVDSTSPENYLKFPAGVHVQRTIVFKQFPSVALARITMTKVIKLITALSHLCGGKEHG